MLKRTTFVPVGLVIIALALGAAAWYVGSAGAGRSGSGYFAVYLSSGDIYIGRLSRFPSLTLRDGYFFRMVANQSDPKQPPNFEMTPMKDFVWAPTVLKFNPEQVLLTAPLSEESQVVKAIRRAAESRP